MNRSTFNQEGVSSCNIMKGLLLRLQSHQTGMGLLQGSVHRFGWQSPGLNLGDHEVLGHFEEGLGHGGISS
jgi:hypothetical protein